MGSAVWWPAAEASGNPNIRHLEGEIKLPKDLRPTTCIGHFSVSVSILSRCIRKVADIDKVPNCLPLVQCPRIQIG